MNQPLSPAEILAAIGAEQSARMLAEYCQAIWDICPEELIAVLERKAAAAAVSDKIRVTALSLIAFVTERLGRRRAGLSLHTAQDLADMDFRFAKKELRAYLNGALQFLQQDFAFDIAGLFADGLATAGDIAQAEKAFAMLRGQEIDHLATVTSFDPAFHAACGAPFADPAPVVHHKARAPQGPLAFVSADMRYFDRFGWDFVASFARQRGEAELAIHIMDAAAAEIEAVMERLGPYDDAVALVSTEWTGHRDTPLARGYYHAARFLRFARILETYADTPAWFLDVDVTFARPFALLHACLADRDLAFNLAPGRLHIRNKILACWIGVAATPAAHALIRRTAGYIAAFVRQQRLPWGIDQVALFAVLTMLRRERAVSIAAIPEAMIMGEAAAVRSAKTQ